MPMNKYPEFILLSKIINKLEDQDYYRTFAKSLIMTNLPEKDIPADENLVKEMFLHFIESGNLQIFFNNNPVSLEDIQAESQRRKLDNRNEIEKSTHLSADEFDLILENEIYINTQALKKLYANKCIVFPSSLLRD